MPKRRTTECSKQGLGAGQEDQSGSLQGAQTRRHRPVDIKHHAHPKIKLRTAWLKVSECDEGGPRDQRENYDFVQVKAKPRAATPQMIHWSSVNRAMAGGHSGNLTSPITSRCFPVNSCKHFPPIVRDAGPLNLLRCISIHAIL